MVSLDLGHLSRESRCPWGLSGKESACQCREMWVQSLDWEEPLEKEMATHSSVLAWEIPGEPGGL